MQIIGTHIRVINPIGPDLTEIHMFPSRLLGVPEGVNRQRLKKHVLSYGPANFVSPDDAEIFERTQAGMEALVDPWLNLSRGIAREVPDRDGTQIGGISDELPQRHQMAAWKKLMMSGEAG